MRREFKMVIEAREDEADGRITLTDVTVPAPDRIVKCPFVDKKMVLGRETALAFMFREAAVILFRRCFPEYVQSKGDQVPEQHGNRILYPGEPGHSSTTGIDPQL